MEEYGFFLSFNNESQAMRLPVNPEKLEINASGDGKTYNIVDLGEINSIQPNKLRELTLESFFPGQRYPFVVGNTLYSPYHYVEMIQKWMEKKRPLRFVFSGLNVPESSLDEKIKLNKQIGEIESERFRSNEAFMAINMAVSIEKFDWSIAAGDSGDIQFKLSLKEYVFYQALKLKFKESKTEVTKKRADNKEAASTYTLVAGDSLWKIAKKKLGDGSRYQEIQKLNNIPDSDLRKLPIGKVIKLPQKEASK